MSNTIKHFLFGTVDSWFFKESRSMDSSGSNTLISLFPPPSKTLLGAIRSQIGEKFHKKNDTNWNKFNKKSDLAKIIGFGDDFGMCNLSSQGAWLYNNQENQLYFPTPANLIRQKSEGLAPYDFFSIGNAIKSDLGTVKFAQLDYKKEQSPLENRFISKSEFNTVLKGNKASKTISEKSILSREGRLGIARDNDTRNAEKGKLYQTEHLRLGDDWNVYLGIDGLNKDDVPADNLIIRLGGEARMSSVVQKENIEIPEPPKVDKNEKKLVIYLLTALPDYRTDSERPPLPNDTFKASSLNDHQIWEGQINSINISIETAIIGKLFRLGGWNMAIHQPQAVKSYIPAGSCWYITLDETQDANEVIEKLHGQFLTTGNEQALGYGQIVIGKQPTLTD